MNDNEQPVTAQIFNQETSQGNFYQALMQWREENQKHLLSDGEFGWYLNNSHAFYHKLPLWANEDDKWE